MEKYIFLFRGGDPGKLSPQEQEAHMQKWFKWVEKLRKSDRYLSGEPLLPGGKTVTGSKKSVTDGPFAESKEGPLLKKDWNISAKLRKAMS